MRQHRHDSAATTEGCAMAERSAGRESFASKLNRLFEIVVPPGRGPYTDTEVSTALSAAGIKGVSHSYLRYLRRGERDNPSLATIQALARFFGVPAAYFFD